MASALDIIIRARDEASAVIQRVSGAGKQLGTQMGGLSQGMKDVGMTLTKTVTPAAGAAALVFRNAGKDWTEGVRSLRAGTGATGAELDALKDSAKNVAGTVTQSFSDTASAMADLSTRTGQTGKPLEDLTTTFMQLEHITGDAASSTIPAVTRMFGDWSVATEDQVGSMDSLFRLAQTSGISVSRLSEQMVQFGSPLRNLGLDMETSAAMFARFEKEGVNVQTAMPGLRMALKNFAAAGIDAKEGLMETFEAIKDAPSKAKAMTIAFDTFGARAGPDMAAAIREGRFELDEYIDIMENGTDTIGDATKESTSLSDRIAMLKNRVMTAIGPFGELGSVIFGGVAAMGPMLLALGNMGPLFSMAGGAAKAFFGILMAHPFILIAVAVVALVVVIVKNWDKIKKFLLQVWNVLKRAWAAVWNAIKRVAIAVWNALKKPVIAYFNFYRTLLRGAIAVARAVWSAIRGVITVAWHAVKASAQRFFGWLKSAWQGVRDVAKGIWDGVIGAARSAFNTIANLWNNTIGRIRIVIPSWVPKIGGKGWSVPDIPTLAEGGIVTRPTLALIGERGPEAVVPLGRRLGGSTQVEIVSGRLRLEGSEAYITDVVVREVNAERGFRDRVGRMKRGA